jgi:hypothetical protein
MTDQGELKITIDLIINNAPEQKDIIFYRINNNENYSGTFIEPGGQSGFTQSLNGFFQDPDNSKFSKFLTIYQANNQAPQPTSTSFLSKLSKLSNLVKPRNARVSPEQTGGKKTKSTRSYNANKTLKNRK